MMKSEDMQQEAIEVGMVQHRHITRGARGLTGI